MKIFSGLVTNKLEMHAHSKSISDGRFISDYRFNKIDQITNYVKIKKVR